MSAASQKNERYNAEELDRRIRAALRNSALYMIVTGEPGTGKSTLVASVPVPKGKSRFILDSEDGMGFLDNGPEGEDIYTPRFHRFQMRRRKMAGAEDLLALYLAMWSPKQSNTIGAVGIDNIYLMQSMLINHLLELTQKPEDFKKFLASFNKPQPIISFSSKIISRAGENWRNMGQDQTIYRAAKSILSNFVLSCRAIGCHFVGATEQGAIWKDYGSPNQEKVGDKPKVLDPFLKYIDISIRLIRGPEEINNNRPPMASILPAQPKMRVQGMNPRWQMDWPGFAAELEAAATRRNEPVPEEAKVVSENISFIDDDQPVPEKQK